MLFSSVILLTSTIASLAAPIRERRATAAAGWPTQENENGKAFGFSGSVNSHLGTEDGAPALVGNYPKGSYAGAKSPPNGPGIAGFQLSADGGPGAGLDDALEAQFSYEIKFPEGFDFVNGGKLPGLYGANSGGSISGQCSGGHHNNECWSARLMWRSDGKGELYAYLPTANQKLPICKGKCDVTYGASIGTGNWSFVPGQWTNITERVRLNDEGKDNGEIEISVNGRSKVIYVDNLTLRTSSEGRIRGAMVHTFFGGSTGDPVHWESPKDQQAFFRNFKIETTQPLNSKTRRMMTRKDHH